MKLKCLLVVLIATTTLWGCSGSGKATDDTSAAAEPTTAESSVAEATLPENTAQEAAEAETAKEDAGTEDTAITDPFEHLILDEYDGLEMTAEVLLRKAILPGTTVPVTVIITNNGNQTISYVHGSGSFSTPEALSVKMEGLQPIIPSDQLGIVTLDFIVKELNPGESLRYTINVMTIEPNASFDTYTHNLFSREQTYLGEVDPSLVLEEYDDLIPAKSGTYTGVVSFVYHTLDDNQSPGLFGEATGYIQAPVSITVNE